ncbi:hypothetical protein [Vibrio sp.]|uniref:hypothetical protein n=1 Tax=Vibrio sp. TaxID=678 RepID=UPI003F6AC1CA
MNNKKKEDLFSQVRTAHRLLAAYYQRLLPTIEQLGKALELDFYVWEPKEFARPTRFTTSPFDGWQWDMLPALSTFYVFKSVKDVNKVRVGEYLVEIIIDSDTGVQSEVANGNQPDGIALPTSVEDAQSVLKISVYTPFENQDCNWYHKVWSVCDHPFYSDEPTPKKDDSGYPVVTCGFELPLSALLEKEAVESIASKAREYIDAALIFAQSQAVTNEGAEA